MLTARVVQNRHVKPEMCTLGQRQPDTSHADNPQRFAVDIHTKPVGTDTLGPFTRFHTFGHFDHTTRGAEYQRHQRICDRLRECSWRVHQ
ncbi:hypothetical protein D3C87_1651570 [compost metagenome]